MTEDFESQKRTWFFELTKTELLYRKVVCKLPHLLGFLQEHTFPQLYIHSVDLGLGKFSCYSVVLANLTCAFELFCTFMSDRCDRWASLLYQALLLLAPKAWAFVILRILRRGKEKRKLHVAWMKNGFTRSLENPDNLCEIYTIVKKQDQKKIIQVAGIIRN